MGSLLRAVKTVVDVGGEALRRGFRAVARVRETLLGPPEEPSTALPWPPAPAPREPAERPTPSAPAPRTPPRTPLSTPPTDADTDTDPIDAALDADGVLRLARMDPSLRDEAVDLAAEVEEVRDQPRGR